MALFLLSTLTSLIICGLLIRYRHIHLWLSGDYDLSGPQKFHHEVTSRVGGIGIATGYLTALASSFLSKPFLFQSLLLIMIAALPIFLAGLIEDLTKNIGVRLRLTAAFLSGLVFLYFFSIDSISLDIPIINSIISYPIVGILFLGFSIAGLSNAYNIIDGFNGLASMVAIIATIAIIYVAFKVQDPLVMNLGFITIGSIIGFFIWNYPRGLIFLGDGGAYLIGFWIAVASILLVVRNTSVSPWFALMVNAYPVFETLFTVWRRAIHQRRNPGLPDGAHFHSLIYRRVMRWAYHDNKPHPYLQNAKTSPYLWLLSSLGVVPAILWWNSTQLLTLSAFLFIIFYVYAYRKIVIFKTPKIITNKNRI